MLKFKEKPEEFTFGHYKIGNLRPEPHKYGPFGDELRNDVLFDAGPYKGRIENRHTGIRTIIDFESTKGIFKKEEFTHRVYYGTKKEDGFAFEFRKPNVCIASIHIKAKWYGLPFFPDVLTPKEIESLNMAGANIEKTGPTMDNVKDVLKVLRREVRRDTFEDNGRRYGIDKGKYEGIEAELSAVTKFKKQIGQAAKLNGEAQELPKNPKIKELLDEVPKQSSLPPIQQ